MIIPGEVLELALAGNAPASVAERLNQLPSEDRKNVLCTLCAMRHEIKRNSREHGKQVEGLLTAECPFFIDSSPTCLTPQRKRRRTLRTPFC
jgi:hypothetical protein